MNVLSLFDGISCGRLALERAGIKVDKYYASEIDKYAIQVAQKNYPDTIQIGDVTKLNYLELLDIDMVIGGSPCFQADTMVFTDKGYVPIQDIQIGDMVLTHNGRYKPVLAVGKRWANNCRKLKAETMLPILTTGNHPFLTDKKFVECDKLNKGDFIIAAKTNFLGEDMSLVDAYLLGRYVADRYVIDSLRAGRKNSYNHKVVFCVGKGKNEQFEFFTFDKHFIKSKDKNVTKYTLIDKNFMELCKKCGKGALNKQIPQIIFSCPTEIKKMFLQGYMDGDGNKYKDGYTATTVSKKLALGLQLLLSSLGCKNHIYFNKRPEKYIIQGRMVNQHDTYQVRFYPNAKEWVKEKKIQSKLQIEDNYVYNIEVADDHTYIADNYIVHNCQDLSIAKQNREGLRGARSGLFWKYVEALEVIKPKWFLLENVASMRNEDRDAITETLRKIYPETECIMINSALVSAQQRKRYYWTNWHVEQPQDKGILLKDILESGQVIRGDKSHAVISSAGRTTEREYFKKNQGNLKAYCLDANYYKGGSLEHNLEKHNRELVAVPCAMRTREDDTGKYKRLETKNDNKANSLTSVQTDSMVAVNIDNYFRKYGTKGKIMSVETEKTQCLTASMGCGGGNNPLIAEPVIIQKGHGYNPGGIKKDKAPTLTSGGSWEQNNHIIEPVRIGELDGLGKGQANRIYSVRGKSVCLNANGGGGGAKTGLYKVDLPDGDYIIRKLTPMECERLQTIPDNFTSGISNTQRYKAIGNGWTVDVIAHILKQIPNN